MWEGGWADAAEVPDQVPETDEHYQEMTDAKKAAVDARSALGAMKEMQNHNHDSPRWQKTTEEYDAMTQASETDPEREPPKIIICSPDDNQTFNEDHIVRIAADARARARDPSEQDQQALDEASRTWSVTRKFEFMLKASPHWTPPTGTGASMWEGGWADAAEVPDQVPETDEHYQEMTDAKKAAADARTALGAMKEMQNHNHDSPRWQRSWDTIHRSLSKIDGNG